MSYFQSIYADENLPHRCKTVYIYLKDRSAVSGSCWPGSEDHCLGSGTVPFHRQAGTKGIRGYWLDTKMVQIPGKW